MDAAILRILDANLNRAREGLRVMEEHARMVLNDARLSAEIKQLRHDLADAAKTIEPHALLSSRDTLGDVGTSISTDSEGARDGAEAVATAACKRVAESLRCIEEFGKTITTDLASRAEAIRYRVYTAEQSLLVTGPRRRKLADARLHVLLTESLCRLPWRDVVAAVLEAGAGAIQLREKGMPDAALLERARELREMTRARGALLIVNDRPDIARLCEADGVHLGRDDLPLRAARSIAGPTVLIGATAHNEAEILAALADEADYIGVGPMFASPTKPDVAINGAALLMAATRLTGRGVGGEGEVGRLNVPVVAIGGIDATNATALVASCGPRSRFSVAICQGVIGSADPAGQVRAILRVFSGERTSDDGVAWTSANGITTS